MVVTAWQSAWIGGDWRLWWVVFGSVSCVGRGLGGGFGVMGQEMGLDRWIGVSWVRWWHGFRSVEIGGFLGGDWWVWIDGDWRVSRWRLGVSWWHGFF